MLCWLIAISGWLAVSVAYKDCYAPSPIHDLHAGEWAVLFDLSEVSTEDAM